jgi:hypothetical protein
LSSIVKLEADTFKESPLFHTQLLAARWGDSGLRQVAHPGKDGGGGARPSTSWIIGEWKQRRRSDGYGNDGVNLYESWY